MVEADVANPVDDWVKVEAVVSNERLDRLDDAGHQCWANTGIELCCQGFLQRLPILSTKLGTMFRQSSFSMDSFGLSNALHCLKEAMAHG